jgi:hypothetical protein
MLCLETCDIVYGTGCCCSVLRAYCYGARLSLRAITDKLLSCLYCAACVLRCMCSAAAQVRISNLPHNTHWTELKDAMRKVGEVIYANVEGDEG